MQVFSETWKLFQSFHKDKKKVEKHCTWVKLGCRTDKSILLKSTICICVTAIQQNNPFHLQITLKNL